MLSVFDADGRCAPRYDDEDLLTVEADACVLAIGQTPDLSFLRPEDGVALTPAGIIRVDPETLATSADGVWAGGDVAFGPRNLIEAVANGKRAARSIHERLGGERARVAATIAIEKIPTPEYRMLAGFEILDREAPPTLDVGRRTGIAEVETGYDDAAARRQAARCLVCHVQTIYDPEACVLCGRGVDVCPEYNRLWVVGSFSTIIVSADGGENWDDKSIGEWNEMEITCADQLTKVVFVIQIPPGQPNSSSFTNS